MYDDTLDSDVSDQNSDKEMKKVMMMIVEAECMMLMGFTIMLLVMF